MCGIAGFLGPSVRSQDAPTVLRRLTDSLAHRGPDDAGEWIDQEASVALGHRRLSILDLSPAGHQPMLCRCGHHVVSYNGEIYNHQALAAELSKAGVCFRGHSDTEVLVEAICAWGMETALQRIEGMFAVAHWDRDEHVLHLARDRSGIKPLYFGMAGRSFVFASELKALRRHPDFRSRVNRGALALYLRLEYVPPPLSIYEGISKLAPGTFVAVRVDETGVEIGNPQTYWSLRDIAEMGSHHPSDLADWAATTKLESLIEQSVVGQRIADVPVGAFLSGGIDSTVVVAALQAVSPEPVPTFSIGFTDLLYDEAPWARAIARYLGTKHTEMYVTPEEMTQVIPQISTLYDEPLAEPSQLPTYLLAQMASKDVKVVMSGDGGDELFGGYGWYQRYRQLWSMNRRLPSAVRKAAARIFIDGPLRRPVARMSRPLDHALAKQPHKLSATLEADDPRDLYLDLRSEWPNAGDLVLGDSCAANTVLNDHEDDFQTDDVRLLAMYLDMCTFLPEHPLTKVDRATMAVGLEARVPLLDRDIVQFAWQLPMHQRIRGETTKFLLREVLYRHLPRALVDRPKVGFAVPIDEWLRGPLQLWAERLLDPDRLRNEGYLDVAPVRAAWDEHLSGKRDRGRALWSVLVFESWLEATEQPAC